MFLSWQSYTQKGNMFHKEVHVYISYFEEQFFNAKLMAWLLF